MGSEFGKYKEIMSNTSSIAPSSSCNANNACGTQKIIDDKMYTYDMPLMIQRNLCLILDEQNVWEDLAYQMGYTKKDVDVSFRRKNHIF